MFCKRSLARVALLTMPLLLTAACDTEEPVPDVDVAETEVTAAEEQVHWTYGAEGGPEEWGGLSPEFAMCETGTMQSPVNLTDATRTDLPDPQFNYQPVPLEIANLGHTVQVAYEPGSTMVLNDTTYELVQFHFHTPAEHRLQGEELPAELHLVHRGPGGQLAVVGVLIEQGSEHAALAPVWNHLPAEPGQEHEVASVRIDAEELLPADAEHYQYPGSLTTPPCTEGVKWLVLNEPIELSAQQIDALRSIIGTSNRPVQPLGTRELRLDS